MSKYAIESINDYKTLFLYDKEQKKVPDRLKENDEKEFKKFVLSFIQPMIDELRGLIRLDEIDVESLG